jgi:hypothetical protein
MNKKYLEYKRSSEKSSLDHFYPLKYKYLR